MSGSILAQPSKQYIEEKCRLYNENSNYQQQTCVANANHCKFLVLLMTIFSTVGIV